MFGLGMGELLVILALALLVFGPKKLPDLAASLGKAIRQFRKATHELTEQIDIDEEVKQPLRELQAALRDEPPSRATIRPPAVSTAVPAATAPAATAPAATATGAATAAAAAAATATAAATPAPSPAAAPKP